MIDGQNPHQNQMQGHNQQHAVHAQAAANPGFLNGIPPFAGGVNPSSTMTGMENSNENSSDFNFLSNLANDFAPEYYQLS